MEHSGPLSAWLGTAFAVLLAAAALPAWAGPPPTAFGVGLVITGSCLVDSRAVVQAGAAAGVPHATCAFGWPVAVQVGRETSPAQGRPGQVAAGASEGPAVVVTLTF